MTEDEVLDEFRASDALLEGHFILSSGRHSPVFLQKMRVFQYPDRTERICRALAAKIRDRFGDVDLIVSPAMGGILPGYETARALGCPAVFVEREEGEFRLRRGFRIPEGARIVMVEDIVTTGLSSRECIAAIRRYNGNLLGLTLSSSVSVDINNVVSPAGPLLISPVLKTGTGAIIDGQVNPTDGAVPNPASITITTPTVVVCVTRCI